MIAEVYGLTVLFENLDSTILTQVAGTDSKPEVIVRFGPFRRCQPGLPDRVYYLPQPSGTVIVAWERVGSAVVSDGNSIEIGRAPGSHESEFWLFILHQVFGVLLMQRGLLPLHASGVEMDGKAVIFSADSGFGKSTLAAHLQSRGARMLSDDIVAIGFDQNERPIAYPSFPLLKLWPESFSGSRDAYEDLPRIDAQSEKRLLTVAPSHFSDSALMLDSIFFLGGGHAISILPSTPQRTILHLITQTYGRSLLPYLGKTAFHFKQVHRVQQSVKAYNLNRPKSLDLLPSVAALIENLVTAPASELEMPVLAPISG